MSSIIRDGDTFHGTSVFGRGVFTNDHCGRVTYAVWTYAGQCRDGYACGLAVLTYSDGTKAYAEHGPDGKYDGRRLDRDADGDTWYGLCERGKVRESVLMSADGRCTYNGEECAPDDPRVLALIAQVAPVEVRPAARAPQPPSARHSDPKPSSDGSRRLALPPAGAGGRRGHRGAPPRRTPSLVAVGHNPTINRTVPRYRFPPEHSWPGFALLESPVSGLAGRGSRGQPATALGGARALRPPSLAGYSRGTEEAVTGCSRSTHGVL
jgi:hypothetical protein